MTALEKEIAWKDYIRAYIKRLNAKPLPKEVNKDSILSVNFKREHKRK